MLRIEVFHANFEGGLVPFYVAKSNFSAMNDKVLILNYIRFVHELGIITESEWANSQQLICDKFNLTIRKTHIDGRKKLSKTLPFFTWYKCLSTIIDKPNMNQSK